MIVANFRTCLWGLIGAVPGISEAQKMSPREILSVLILLGVIYLGGSGVFMLGFILFLPSAVIALVNEVTLVHIFSEIMFFVILALAAFKVSVLIILGVVSVALSLVVKIGSSQSRGGRVRDALLFRLVRMKYRAYVQGGKHWCYILFAALLSAAVFLFTTFFPVSTDSSVVSFSGYALVLLLVFLCFISVLSVLSLYEGSSRKTGGGAFSSDLLRRSLISIAVVLCFLFGMLRLYALKQGPEIFFPSASKSCELAVIMPVLGGLLLFDRASLNYIVVSASDVVFFAPDREFVKEPACV